MSIDGEIRAALSEVWDDARQAFAERVATIELATRELAHEAPDSGLIASACSEAHKLAGVLGTFGLDRGSELARDLAEHLDGPGARGEAARLQRLAAELRGVIETDRP